MLNMLKDPAKRAEWVIRTAIGAVPGLRHYNAWPADSDCAGDDRR